MKPVQEWPTSSAPAGSDGQGRVAADKPGGIERFQQHAIKDVLSAGFMMNMRNIDWYLVQSPGANVEGDPQTFQGPEDASPDAIRAQVAERAHLSPTSTVLIHVACRWRDLRDLTSLPNGDLELKIVDQPAGAQISNAGATAGPGFQDNAELDLMLLRDSASRGAELSNLVQYSPQPGFPIHDYRDGRPAKLPLELMHPVYGCFRDVFHGRETIVEPRGSRLEIVDGHVNILDMTDMSARPHSFEAKVVGLCKASVRFYPRETNRLNNEDGITAELENIFGADLESLRLTGRQGQAGFDLACLSTQDQGTRPDLYHVLEVKDELYSTNSDAFYESFLSFYSYLREHRTSTEGKRCSCFLTVVMGPWICVGALCRENGISFSALTPLVPLMLYDSAAQTSVVNLCWSLHTVTQLMQRGEPLPLIQDAMQLGGLPLPYPLHGFHVREKLSGVESWLVYLIDLDGDVAVAKLADRYGWAVHKAWADAGVAPQLHLEHCRELAGSWKLIIMEYLKPEKGWRPVHESDDSPALFQAIEDALCCARDRSPSSVHGDLRRSNILVREPCLESTPEAWEVKIIDFDWAGVEGEATFAPILNHKSIGWPEGAVGGARILQKHDDAFICDIIGSTQAASHVRGEAAFALLPSQSPAQAPGGLFVSLQGDGILSICRPMVQHLEI
ncbi:hypothetical protein WJX74_007851 [Apatococcus lobatus]|uniref:Protein kinase domain-containing protein n=1 Tax=Apatococcus lobatus TaxID=904363 RepID=A0AAW1QWC9_9CHLO